MGAAIGCGIVGHVGHTGLLGTNWGRVGHVGLGSCTGVTVGGVCGVVGMLTGTAIGWVTVVLAPVGVTADHDGLSGGSPQRQWS